MSARSNTSSLRDRRRALRNAVIGALVGAMVVCVVIVASIYGWLDFNSRPRISAISILLGLVGFIYGAVKIGVAISGLGELHAVRTQQRDAADHTKPRSG